MSVYRNWTTDPIASPVTAQELADWLRLDDATDPVLAPTLLLATQLVENFLNLALLPRVWNLVYSAWPTIGTPSPGLSRSGLANACAIALPFAAYELVEVLTVDFYGEASTDFVITSGAPATLEITSIPLIVIDPPEPALVVTYRTGYAVTEGSGGASENAVPAGIKQALLMVAGYLFKNRGACNVQNAIKESGADAFLYPFRQTPVVM